MLKIRVIPTLLWKGPGLVKGTGFDSWRRIGTLLPAIRVYNTRDVDELILLDIEANQTNDPPDDATIRDIAPHCTVPLTVGGGITCLDHIRRLLQAGADKVAINSAAFETPSLIREAAHRFGSQCIVVSIDARRHEDGHYECFTHSGTRATGLSPEKAARKMAALGAGEILITSIERDGTLKGYDIPLIKSICDAVDIPVIASGGAGSYADLTRAVSEGGACAIAAASMFHFTEQTPAGARQALLDAGIPVRRVFSPVTGD